MEGKHGGVESEGKLGGEDVEWIDVEKIKFLDSTNLCNLQDPLHFRIHFSTLRPISNAKWEVKYLVDCVRNRFIQILGESEEEDYDGMCVFNFKVDTIDVSNINPGHLSNSGLLICTLKTDNTEIAEIKMVVQVSPRKKEDSNEEELVRCIYNPLE